MQKILVLFFLLCATTVLAQSAAQKYVTRYDSLAIGIMQEKGIPASLILGIGIHESAAGTSKLCRLHHNHFGVKGHPAALKFGRYRHFESDEAAYRHFSAYLASRKFYGRLQGDMDYLKWLEALRLSGYAASVTWKGQVISIIKKNDLSRFDLKPADTARPEQRD